MCNECSRRLDRNTFSTARVAEKSFHKHEASTKTRSCCVTEYRGELPHNERDVSFPRPPGRLGLRRLVLGLTASSSACLPSSLDCLPPLTLAPPRPSSSLLLLLLSCLPPRSLASASPIRLFFFGCRRAPRLAHLLLGLEKRGVGLSCARVCLVVQDCPARGSSFVAPWRRSTLAIGCKPLDCVVWLRFRGAPPFAVPWTWLHVWFARGVLEAVLSVLCSRQPSSSGQRAEGGVPKVLG